MQSSQAKIALPDDVDLATFCGPADANLRAIEELFEVTVTLRPDCVLVTGDDSESAVISALVGDLFEMMKSGKSPTVEDVNRAAEVLRNSDYSPNSLREDTLLTYRGRAIRPKTSGQKRYCDAMRTSTITFAIGPAGTGKTYLAMAMAITAFKREEVSRIILTRPAIEAGEKLGFLPGDLQSKVDPYLRPLYDALYQIMGVESFQKNMEKGLIEVAPLAYMRGRTLDNAFIILDEAQNTTPAQMKMFLTRIGFGSKVVVTGDATQKDLAPGSVSGMDVALKVLKRVEDIGICQLTSSDVVRHPLVQKIVNAYEEYDKQERRGSKDKNRDRGRSRKK